MSDSEEIIEDVPVMSFREDHVKLLEKDVVIYDSEEDQYYGKVKDAQNLMNVSNKEDTRHSDHMAHSVEEPSVKLRPTSSSYSTPNSSYQVTVLKHQVFRVSPISLHIVLQNEVRN
ncbi:hypothetical protein Bca4012_009006 [Brassica carinata]